MPVTFSPSALSEARRRLYGADAGQSTSRAAQLAKIERDAYEQQVRANKAAADAERKAIEDAAKQADDERKLANAQRTNELLAQGRRYHLDRVTGEPRPLQTDEEFAAGKADKARKAQEAQARKEQDAKEKAELDKVAADEAILRENEKSIQRNQQREELEREEKRRKLKGIQDEYEKRLKAADDLELDLTPEQRQATVGTIENVKKRLADIDSQKFKKQKESLKFDTAQDERESLLRKREAAIKRGEAPTPSPEPLIADPVEFEQSAAQHEQEVQQFNAEQAQQQAKFDALEAENKRLMSLPHSAADVSTDGKWHKDVIPQINALNQAAQSRSPELQAKQQRIQEQARVLNESATAINTQAKAANERAKAEQAAARDAAYQDFEKVSPGMGKEYQAILDDSDKRAAALRTKYAGREDAPEAKAAFTALETDITGKLDGLNGKIETTQKAKSANLEKLWNQFGAGDLGTATMRNWVTDKSTDPEYDKLGGVSSMPANFKAKIKELGLNEQEARNYMETRRQLDWSSPLDPEKAAKSAELTRPLREKLGITDMLEPVRRLPNGAIIPNPVLGGDEEAFKKTIEAADGTPEQKAEAMKLWPSYRRQYGEGLLSAFAKQSAFGEDFTEWRESGKAKSTDPVEQALQYQDEMKGRSAFRRWGDLIASNVTAGFMDVAQAALGTSAAVLGAVPGIGKGLSELAGANAENAASLVNTQEQLSNTGFAGSLAATIARMAPGVAATVGTGSMAGGMIFGGAQTAGSLYGDAYNTLRNEGKSHLEAWKASAPASLAAGAMTAGLTKLFPGGVTALANNPEARASVRAMVAGFMSSGKAITKGALDEIPEEVIDEAMSQLAQGYAEGRNPDDVVRDFITGLPELVVASGLMGGGMQALKDRMDRRAGGLPPDIAPETPEVPTSYAGPLPEERAAIQAAIAAFNPTAPEAIQAMPAVIRTVPKGQEGGINAKARAAMDAVAGIASGEITDPASLTETQMRALGVKLDKNRKLVPAGGANSPAPLIYTRTNKAGVDQIIITDEARDWLKNALPDLTIGQSEAERIQAINTSKPKPEPKQEMSGTRLRKIAQNRQNELTWKRDGKAGDEKAGTIATNPRQLSKDEEAELEFLDKHLADDNTQAIADKYGIKLKSAIISGVGATSPSLPSIEADQKTAGETLSSLMARTKGNPKGYETAQAARTAAAKRILASLKKGDVIEDTEDSGRGDLVVQSVSKDGKMVFVEGAGDPISHTIFMAGTATDAQGNRIDTPASAIRRKKPIAETGPRNEAPAPEAAPEAKPGPSVSEGAVEGASPDRQAKVDSLRAQGGDVVIVQDDAAAEALIGAPLVNKGRRGVTTRVNGKPTVVLIKANMAGDSRSVDALLDEELHHAATLMVMDESPDLAAAAELEAAAITDGGAIHSDFAKLSTKGRVVEAAAAYVSGKWKPGKQSKIRQMVNAIVAKIAKSLNITTKEAKPLAIDAIRRLAAEAEAKIAPTPRAAGAVAPSLTPAQTEQMATAQAQYDSAMRSANADPDPAIKEKKKKAAGMRFAAAKRQIIGNLTAKEAAAKAKREASNFEGKIVTVDGRKAEVIGNTFGRVKVKFEDGTKAVVAADKVKSQTDTKADISAAETALTAEEKAPAEVDTGHELIVQARARLIAVVQTASAADKPKATAAAKAILDGLRRYNGHIPIVLTDDPAFDFAWGRREQALIINPETALARFVNDSTDADNAAAQARQFFRHELIHKFVVEQLGDARVMDIWNQLPKDVQKKIEKAYSVRRVASDLEPKPLNPDHGGHEYYRAMLEAMKDGTMTEQVIGKDLADKWRKFLDDVISLMRDLRKQFASIKSESARNDLIAQVNQDIKLVSDALDAFEKSISPDAEPAQTQNAGAGSTSGKPVEGSSTTVANPVSINTEKESSGNDGIGSVYETVHNGKPKWAVQMSEKRGFGDYLFDTESEANKASEIERMNRESRAKSIAEAAAREQEQAAKKAAQEKEPRAYAKAAGMSQVSTDRAVSVLVQPASRRSQSAGKIYTGTKAEVAAQMVADGYMPKKRDNGFVFEQGDGDSIFKVTKIEHDYAKWLVSQNQAPEVAKPTAEAPAEQDQQPVSPPTTFSPEAQSEQEAVPVSAKVVTPEMIASKVEELLRAPTKTTKKPAVAFGSQTEENAFKSGFEAATQKQGEMPPPEKTGLSPKDRRWDDAWRKGWASGQIFVRSLPDTPATAEAKVEEQVQVVAATEGQRDAKEIKKEIAEKLDAAIAAALKNESPRAKEIRKEIEGQEIIKKEIASAAAKRNATKTITRLQKELDRETRSNAVITIQIPGDGTFKVFNNVETLRNIRRRVSLIETDVKPDAPQRSEQDNRKQDAINLADGASERFGGPLAAIEWLKEQMADSTDSVKEWYQSAIDILSKRKGDIAREEAEQSTPESESTSTAGVDESALNTPMMKQWRTLREPLDANTVLLVRLGDFYEAFGNDAKVLSDLAKVALTKRNGIPMAGIPHHASTSYIQKLVSAGKRVAIAEQVGDAKPGVPTEREVTSITPESPEVEITLSKVSTLTERLIRGLLARGHEIAPSGPASAEFRQDVLEALVGVRPPKAKAGVNAVESALYDVFNINRDQTKAKQDDDLRDELKKMLAASMVSKTPSEMAAEPESREEVAPASIGRMTPKIINKDWTALTEKEGPPSLNQDYTGYGEWRRVVAAKILPSGTQIQREALAIELANEIERENGKPDVESWQHHIIARNVASQIMTGERADVLSRAETRALSDEYAQWFSGRMFDGESVSAAAYDANAKGRPIPAGFERKGEMISPIASESAAPEVETPPEPTTPPVIPPAKRTKKTISKIEDVGEKIGGARKDRWKERGLAMSDYDGLTDTEKQAYTNKAQVFPKPDYQVMIDGGMDKPMAYALKEVYDSIAPKPNLTRAQQADPAQRDAALRLYVETVGKIRDGLKAVKTPEELKALRDTVFESSPTGYGGRLTYTADAKAIMHLVSTGKRRYELPGAMEVTGYDLRNLARKLEKLPAWPAPQEQWQRMFDIRRIPIGSVLSTKLPDGTWDKTTVTVNTPPVWQVTKDYRILSEHSSQEVAEAWAKAAAVKSRKEDPKRPYNADVKRTGPDYRKGRDVTGDELLAEFGFRGAEFGLWTNDSDRQQSLNQAFDGLHDLARILNVPPKAISLNGELGIAFGARGSGKFAAHYEPSRIVINLTKTSGAGALAHEWAHAMDDYFGRMATSGQSGKYVSYGARGTEAFRAELAATINEVMKAISERQWTQPEYIADLKERNATAQKKTDSWLKSVERSTEKVKLTPEQKDEVDTYTAQLRGQRMPEALVNGRPDMTQVATKMLAIIDSAAKAQKIRVDWPVTGGGKMSDLAAGLGRHSGMIFATNNDLARAEAGDMQVPNRTVPTNTLKASQEQGDYWQRKHELFARSFEAFIEDSIRREGNQSPYLVGFTADSGSWGNLYPQGDERAATNEAFQKMVDTLKSRETDKGVALFATPTAPKVSIPDLHAAFITAKRQQGDTPRVSAVYAAAKSKNPDLTRQEFMQAVQSGQYAPLVTIQDGKMTLAPITDAEIMDAAENATETPEAILEEWAATEEPLQASPTDRKMLEWAQFSWEQRNALAQDIRNIKLTDIPHPVVLKWAQKTINYFADRAQDGLLQARDYNRESFYPIYRQDWSKLQDEFRPAALVIEEAIANVAAGRLSNGNASNLSYQQGGASSAEAGLDTQAGDGSLQVPEEKWNPPGKEREKTRFVATNEARGLRRVAATREILEKFIENQGYDAGEWIIEAEPSTVAEPLQASPTSLRDAEYMAAVEAGDMETAQRMVDEAAKAAGYNVGPVWHGTVQKPFTVFRSDHPSHFGSKQQAEYRVNFWMQEKSPDILATGNIDPDSRTPNYVTAFLKIKNPQRVTDQDNQDGWTDTAGIAKKQGYDGLVYRNDTEGNGDDSYVTFSPNQIKSADPVTYDNDGNVIPLSQRFNPESDSILYATPTTRRRNVANQASNLPGARDAWSKLSQTYEDKELEKVSYQKIEAAIDEVISEQEGFDRLYDQIIGKMRNGIVLSLEEDIARRMIARVLWIDGNDNPTSRTKAKLLFMADMREASETARKLGSRVDKVETPQQRLDNAMRNVLSPSSKMVRERLVNVWSGAEKLAAIRELERRLASTQDTLQRERAQRELEKAQARKDQNEVMEELAREDDAKVDAILKRNGLTQADLFLSVDDRFAMQEAILGLARVHLSQQSAAHKKAIEMSVRGYSDNAIAKETGLSVAEVSNTAEHFRNVVAKQAVSKEVGKGNTFSKFIQWGKRIISEMSGPLRASPTAPLGGMVAKGTPSAAAVAAQIQAILNASIPTKGQRNAMSLHAATAKGKNGQNVKVFVPYNPADWKQVYRVARELSTREATKLDKAYEYWINGILSGPQTHVVNTASNLLSTAWAYGPQWFAEATANVAIRNPNAPQFGEFKHVWAGFYKGIMPALRNFALAWDTEADPVEHQYLNKPVTVMFQGGNLDKVGGIRPSFGGTLGRYVRMPGRFLVAQDAFAKTLIMHAESAAMAYRLGKKQGLAGVALENFMASQIATHGSESWQHAFEKAVELTFQDENDITKSVEGVTNALKRAKFVGGLLRYLLPFVRTPTNIYRAGIRKAGGSAGMLLYRLGKSGYYAVKGDSNEFRSYREGAMVKDVSESVMALALWFIVMGMSEGDDDDNQKTIEITGSRPFGVASAGERASQLRQEGGSNLIIIRKNPLTGEKLDKPIQFAYGRYEPIALALSTLVDGAREFKKWTRFQPENRTTDKLGGSIMRHVLAQAKEKTFLQGVSGVLQFIEDAGSNNFSGKDLLLKNFMNGAIPNLIRQPYRLSQDEIADAKKAESELSRSLGIGQPKVNEAGQPVQRGGNAVTRVLFPVASKASTELFDAALKKWNTTNPDQQWNPDPLTKADLYVYGPKVDGKTQQVPLTDPRKITQFEQQIGQKFADYSARKLMAAGWRQGKPVTAQMIDAIKKIRTDSIKSVRASMGREERFGTTTPAAAPSTPPARPSPAPSTPVSSTPPRPVPIKDDAAERAKARLIEARKRLNYGSK
jgi:hypothetical protein